VVLRIMFHRVDIPIILELRYELILLSVMHLSRHPYRSYRCPRTQLSISVLSV
jgi:hypothetical protein